jgi:hypothetical protein
LHGPLLIRKTQRGAALVHVMTNARRALLVSAAVVASVPALPAPTASADPIFRCSASFPTAPVRCRLAAEETRFWAENPELAAIRQQYVDPVLWP